MVNADQPVFVVSLDSHLVLSPFKSRNEIQRRKGVIGIRGVPFAEGELHEGDTYSDREVPEPGKDASKQRPLTAMPSTADVKT